MFNVGDKVRVREDSETSHKNRVGYVTIIHKMGGMGRTMFSVRLRDEEGQTFFFPFYGKELTKIEDKHV